MRPGSAGMGPGGMPRVGKAVRGLLIANVAIYIAELLALRAGIRVDEHLFLTARDVFEGKVWQLFTAGFLHDPGNAFHLLFNMLALWIFGAPLEHSWGPRRLLIAYVVCMMSGHALTLIIAALSMTPVLSWAIPTFPEVAHVGASGATMGLTIAWAVVNARQQMAFLFMGAMTGRTFAMIMVGIQLLVALSYDKTSSTSHFGGMIGGFVLVKGLWRPSNWAGLFKKSSLEARKKKLEHELRVIEGGRGKKSDEDLPN